MYKYRKNMFTMCYTMHSYAIGLDLSKGLIAKSNTIDDSYLNGLKTLVEFHR